MDSYASHGGGGGGGDDAIATTIIFKFTSNSDLVVPRRIRLLANKFYTFHDENDPNNRKSWYLDRRCQLVPRVAQEIAQQAITKCVRPRKTWTITASLKGKGEHVQLYMFTLVWPRSWAAKGYTSFQFGFKSFEEAQAWHDHLSRCIAGLRSSASSGKRSSSKGAALMLTPSPSTDIYRQNFASAVNSKAGSVYEGGGGKEGDAYDSATNGGGGPSTRMYEADAESLTGRSASPSAHTASGSAGFRPVPPLRTPGEEEAEQLALLAAMDESSDEEEAADGYSSPGPGGGRAVLEQSKLMERWVPYKQVNGLSVYYHKHSHDSEEQGGGEYMVSAVVHGSPKRVLDVLMKGSANTTILGPARKVEVLEFTKVDDDTTKELVRLTIEAPGWAGVFCAAREIVVERMCKTDESRCFVVMFNSSDDVALRSRAYQAKPGLCSMDLGPAPSGDNLQTRETQEEAVGQSTQRSIWRRPVQGQVSGAYTISCLNNHSLANSSESLITCMVKVDLGGAIAANSWTGVLCDLVGWREAFLDRILMNVMLVRDEVEYRRFKVQPQDMMSAQPQGTSRGPDAQQHPAGPQPAPGIMRRSMTMAKGAARAISAFGPSGPSDHLHNARVNSNGLLLSPVAGLPTSPGKLRLAAAASPLPAMEEESAERLSSASASFDGAAAAHAAQQQLGGGGGASAAALARGGGAAVSGSSQLPPTAEDEPGGGATALAVLDYELMASLSTLERKYWESIHTEGTDAPYNVRGPTYLKDKKKVPAGKVQFAFAAMDWIEIPHVVEHVARFLPSVRSSGVPFAVIINLVIPGNPLLGVVATFATEQHPGKVLTNPPSDPMEEGHNWQPFDFVMHKFYHGDDETRNKMIKLIPHIADGSWMIKSSVGTTPVILGKQLKTSYHVTPQYIEVDIDISANNVAAYVTGLVRGATKSLVIDMGFVLEGTAPWELPETLLGAIRLNHLDPRTAKKIDVSREIPLKPPHFIPDPEFDTPALARAPSAAAHPPPAPPPGSGALATRFSSFEAAGAEAAAAAAGSQLPPAPVSGGLAGSRGGTEPSTPSLAQQQRGGGMGLSQGYPSAPAPSSAFGLRHRGHTRTTSNAESVQSALNGSSTALLQQQQQ